MQNDFIPVAANTAFLAPEDKKSRNWCESSRFVEGVIKKSKLRKQDSSETAQGYYAFSAAGDFYGANNNEREEVLAMLQRAKKDFASNPARKIAVKEKILGAEAKVPEGAAVLNVFSRIQPMPEGIAADDLNRSVGRDHLWILKKDIETILSRLENAAQADAPDALALRLVRFHLVDNVRGEPDHWAAENVKSRSFKIEKLDAVGDSVKVKLSGAYSMVMPPRKRDEEPHDVPEMGLSGTLEGILTIDRKSQALKDAKIFAGGEGWGESTFTSGAPKGRFPLKFAMVLAHDRYATQIAPQAALSDPEVYLEPGR